MRYEDFNSDQDEIGGGFSNDAVIIPRIRAVHYERPPWTLWNEYQQGWYRLLCKAACEAFDEYLTRGVEWTETGLLVESYGPCEEHDEKWKHYDGEVCCINERLLDYTRNVTT